MCGTKKQLTGSKCRWTARNSARFLLVDDNHHYIELSAICMRFFVRVSGNYSGFANSSDLYRERDT